MKNIAFIFLLIPALSGCLKSNDNKCSYDECATKAPASEISSVQAYLTANSITATQHCSGLFYRVDNPGTGSSPNACSNVSVTYEGRLTNGTVFDAAASPVGFNLSSLITAWRNGLPYVKAGGRIYLYVPPTLGYGSQTVGSIPGNSILIFKIDLLSVQ